MFSCSRIYYLLRKIHIARNVDFEVGEWNVHKSEINFSSKAKIKIGSGVRICNSHIEVIGGTLWIDDNVNISNYSIQVLSGGFLHIGEHCYLEKGNNWRNPFIYVWDGSMVDVSHHNLLRCDIHSRFNSNLTIGVYNCINERTEIRCDENVSIGSFNMISYNCRIWDTNTHKFYTGDTRRQITIQKFPNIGAEIERPTTKPISINNNCLLGEECVILKGSIVENGCVIGIRTVLPGRYVPINSVVVGNPAQIKK